MLSAEEAKKKLIEDEKGMEVIGAIYHIEDGTVEFLPDGEEA